MFYITNIIYNKYQNIQHDRLKTFVNLSIPVTNTKKVKEKLNIFHRMARLICANQAADLYVPEKDNVKENISTQKKCEEEESSPIARPLRKKQKHSIVLEKRESQDKNPLDELPRITSSDPLVEDDDFSEHTPTPTLSYTQHNCPIHIDLKKKENAIMLLGSGANSDVYSLSSEVAIKVYKNKARQQKITAEMNTLRVLHDIPNIPKFISFTTNVMVVNNNNNNIHPCTSAMDAFQRGIIMERFEGVDLFDALMNTHEIRYPSSEQIIFEEFLPGKFIFTFSVLLKKQCTNNIRIHVILNKNRLFDDFKKFA
jgi:hypothetical protein